MKTHFQETAMNDKISLDQLRRKAYLAYHQDGIIDMLIGATVIGFGIWRISENIIFTSLSWLSFTVYIGLKRAITIPRFGFVRFSETQRKAQFSIALGLLMLLVLSVGGLFFFARPELIPSGVHIFMRKFHEFVISGVVALFMILFGLLFGIRRIAGYGAFMLAALWLAIQLGWPGGPTLVSIGCLILALGIALLVRFIRKYPLQPTESGNAI
jgi:hypothetical protein